MHLLSGCYECSRRWEQARNGYSQSHLQHETKPSLVYHVLDFKLVNLDINFKKENSTLPTSQYLEAYLKCHPLVHGVALLCETHFATSVTKASWIESKVNSYHMESHSKDKHGSSRRTSHLYRVPAMQPEFDVSTDISSEFRNSRLWSTCGSPSPSGTWDEKAGWEGEGVKNFLLLSLFSHF